MGDRANIVIRDEFPRYAQTWDNLTTVAVER
jgi:hypothetical protein